MKTKNLLMLGIIFSIVVIGATIPFAYLNYIANVDEIIIEEEEPEEEPIDLGPDGVTNETEPIFVGPENPEEEIIEEEIIEEEIIEESPIIYVDIVEPLLSPWWSRTIEYNIIEYNFNENSYIIVNVKCQGALVVYNVDSYLIAIQSYRNLVFHVYSGSSNYANAHNYIEVKFNGVSSNEINYDSTGIEYYEDKDVQIDGKTFYFELKVKVLLTPSRM